GREDALLPVGRAPRAAPARWPGPARAGAARERPRRSSHTAARPRSAAPAPRLARAMPRDAASTSSGKLALPAPSEPATLTVTVQRPAPGKARSATWLIPFGSRPRSPATETEPPAAPSGWAPTRTMASGTGRKLPGRSTLTAIWQASVRGRFGWVHAITTQGPTRSLSRRAPAT